MVRQAQSPSRKKAKTNGKAEEPVQVPQRVVVIELVGDHPMMMNFQTNGVGEYELPTVLRIAAQLAEQKLGVER